MKTTFYILFFVAAIPLIIATSLALTVDSLNKPFEFTMVFMFSILPSSFMMIAIEMIKISKLWKQYFKNN